MKAAAQRHHARTMRNVRRLAGGPVRLTITGDMIRQRLDGFDEDDLERQAILRDLFAHYPRAFETQPRR